MSWELKTWDQVLTIKNGKSQKKVVNPEGAYPIYGSGGIMGYADEFLCDEGTTIIGRKGSINNPIYVEEKFWNVDTAFGLVPGELLDNKFFYYFCTTYNFLKHNKATTLPSLTKADLLKIEIPLPPLNQQKKIAAILDAADEYRQKTKALIAKYDELAQSLFLDMFGDLRKYPKEVMKDAVKFIDYRGKSPNKVDSGIPLLTAKNVKAGYISEEPREFIPVEDYEGWMVRGFPKTGNVLFTTEAPLGQAALLPHYEKVAIAQRLICFQPSERLDSNYLLYTILSPLFQGELSKRATGSTAKGIRSKELAKIEIPIPPLHIQKDFNEKVKAIESQKTQAQDSLAKAEDLFNSLLQRAFKGELT